MTATSGGRVRATRFTGLAPQCRGRRHGHTFATLLLQAGAQITYVSQQLGHADAAITLRVYVHYLPDVSQKDVDLLDTQPSATPAQPDVPVSAAEASEREELLGKSGEPRRNRTFNPQIKSLLLCQLS